DDTARTNAGQSGAADVIENVSADNASLLEGAGMTVEEKEGFNLPFLLFNTEKEPLTMSVSARHSTALSTSSSWWTTTCPVKQPKQRPSCLKVTQTTLRLTLI